MSKTRLTISIPADDAERVKAAAARAGEDVSGYVRNAAMEIVARDERAAAVFSDLDDAIADAETVDGPPDPPVEVTPAEQERIDRKWDEVLGPASRRGAA